MRRFFAAAAFAALLLAPTMARAEDYQCSLENIASPAEIQEGWKLYLVREIVDQADSAPVEESKGNWFVIRTTNIQPNCRAFDDMGNYSLRSYMLPKRVETQKLQVCQATADGGSVAMDPPQGVKPHPPNDAIQVFDTYDRPWAGTCPPAKKPAS